MDVVLNAEILRERDEYELCVAYNEVGEFDLYGHHNGEEVRLITDDLDELIKTLESCKRAYDEDGWDRFIEMIHCMIADD
jgi:hypothetical protein